MKKILCCLFAVLLLLTLSLPAFAEEDIRVMLDAEQITFDVPPQIIKGRTMVPIRAIFEALGAEVDWDAATRTVTATIDDYVVHCTIDKTTMLVCGERVEMDVAPVIVEGRTLMPARFAAEAFVCTVGWDGPTRTVYIVSNGYTDTGDDMHGGQ